jgi:hypothetical protein
MSCVRFPIGSLEFVIDLILTAQEYFLGGKGGGCVGLTTLPSSCANFMLNLGASTMISLPNVFLRRSLFFKDLLPSGVLLCFETSAESHTVAVLTSLWTTKNLRRFWLQNYHKKFNEHLSLDYKFNWYGDTNKQACIFLQRMDAVLRVQP